MTERPNRRLTDGNRNDTPKARQARLIRAIASDPVLLNWLGGLIARILDRAATDIAIDGRIDCANAVRTRADQYRSGAISPFL